MVIDLDNSVFRNFKRFVKSNIQKCISNDCRFWVVDKIVEDLNDYKETLKVIENNYQVMGEFHHTYSAKGPDFPKI